jgi:hypothetical protein
MRGSIWSSVIRSKPEDRLIGAVPVVMEEALYSDEEQGYDGERDLNPL